MFFKSRESKRFGLGDLVYDEFYGSGLVIDFDKRFDDMEVNFLKEGRIWLTPISLKNLTIVSKGKDREKANILLTK